METTERSRVDRLDPEATRATTPADSQPSDTRGGKPLMVMVAAALAATALVLGMMWINNTRSDSASARAIAAQGE